MRSQIFNPSPKVLKWQLVNGLQTAVIRIGERNVRMVEDVRIPAPRLYRDLDGYDGYVGKHAKKSGI